MRGKAPQDIFFDAEFAQIEPVGINVIDFAQLTRVNNLLELDDGRMIKKYVLYHHFKIAVLGDPVEFFSLTAHKGQRFFHKRMFICR